MSLTSSSRAPQYLSHLPLLPALRVALDCPLLCDVGDRWELGLQGTRFAMESARQGPTLQWPHLWRGSGVLNVHGHTCLGKGGFVRTAWELLNPGV